MNNSRAFLFAVCWFVMLACMTLGGCSVAKPVDGNNCLDWANANKRSNEKVVIGFYLPVRGLSHAWLKNGEYCRDNMRNFKCDDKRYMQLNMIDAGDSDVMQKLMGAMA